MSFKVTNWVWAKSESRNGARLVLLALADRADDTGFAWPSIEDLCERAKLSPRAVQKGIAKLVEIGELEVESGGGRRVRNRYRIVPKPRTSDGVTDEYPRSPDGVTDGKPRTFDGVSPQETPSFATETPHYATETPSFAHGNPVISAGEPPLEPPGEPSENHHNYPAAVDDRLPVVRKDGSGSHPAWLAPLKDAMSAAGINVPWKFRGDDLVRLDNDIQRLGIPLMIEQALKAERAATEPPFSSRWFYDGWHAMHTPVAIGDGPADGSNVVAIRAPGRPLPGTDTTVAGWDAVAAELRAKENPA
jgi:Helix-turn-helix domain